LIYLNLNAKIQRLSTTLTDYQMSEPWVKAAQAAKHLGVAKDSIYRWIDTKGLPAHRIGRLWKFKLSELDAWVVSGKAADPDDNPQAKREC
jgi:excisionase family DNA binding protein